MPVADDLQTEQTAAPLSRVNDEPTVPEAGRLPSAQASENPLPIELPMEQTAASTPQARSLRTWFRRARVVAGAVGFAALGLLSAVSVSTVGARARARATRTTSAEQAALPQAASSAVATPPAPGEAPTVLEAVSALTQESSGVGGLAPAEFAAPAPAAPAAPLAALRTPSPPAVSVMSLPVASATSNSRISSAAHKTTPSRPHASAKGAAKTSSPPVRSASSSDAKPDVDAPGKPLSPFDAIGGRE
jgi:hypothetical protein